MVKKYEDSSIISIREDRDRVRKRPTMHIPTTGIEGTQHIIFEIIDNGIDEITAGGSIGTTVTVMFNEKTKEVTVIDDGRGIPHGKDNQKLIDVCTVLHTSGKFDNTDETAYQTSGGTNGVGLKLAVFLSEYCTVTSMYEGKQVKVSFEDGLLTDVKETKTSHHGTVVNFKLSGKYLETKTLTADILKNKLQEKSYLFPDYKLRYVVANGDKEVGNYVFKGKNMLDRIKEWKPDTDIIYINETVEVNYVEKAIDTKVKNSKVIVEMGFALKEDIIDSDEAGKYLISYGNTIRTTTGGQHVEGLKDGIKKFFAKEMPERLNKKEKETLQINPMDMIAGLVAFISVKVNEPEFRGQYKDQLSNIEARYAVKDAVFNALSREKESVIKKMAEFIKTVAKSRMASKKARKKDVSNAFSEDRINKYLPYIESIFTTDPEVMVVEGDSAFDAVSPGRDKFNQGIYSMTGRPDNMIDADDDVMAKATTAFNEIIDIAGCGLGKGFDIKKMKLKRIVLMPDADTDGDAMAVSLMGLFARFTPELVEKGYIYRVVPPLYSFKEGKKKIYVSSQKEFFKYLKEKFSGNIELFKLGKKCNEKDIMTFLEINFDYNDKLKKLAKRYSVESKLMEQIVLKYRNNDKDVFTVKYWEKVMKPYRDLSVSLEDKYVTIEGTDGDEYVHIVMDQYFEHNIKKFKKCQQRNLFINGYKLNNKDNLSIYEVMEEFNKYMPSQIVRHKGLGELNPKELGEVCVNKKNRTLLKVKFKDYANDMEKIYVILSSKKKYKAIRSEILLNKVADEMEIDT